MILFLFAIISITLSQLQDEQQLTNAACVIFSRFYLQQNQEMAGRAIGEMIQTQGLSKEDAIQYATVPLVEQCLDTITSQETMEIIQSLQTQKMDVETHKHLVESADIKKYGSKKKSAKKTEILKIIKQIDDMIMQQRKDIEGGNDPNDQSTSQKDKRRQRDKKQSNDLTDLSIFEIKEWLVLSSFALVGILLIYIICCVPERKKKEKKDKKNKQVVQQEEEKSEITPEDNNNKQKVE